MADETPPRSAGASDRRGYPGGSGGQPTPLQTRAHFLKNRDWASVTEINRGLCARGGAQSDVGRETHDAVAREWEETRKRELTLEETFEFLRSCHRRAPFLFFNGNTFAEIGRALANALFHDLPFVRRKEAASAAAHFITGVLDREAMVGIIESLCETAELKIGDRVQTLKGSLRGAITRVLDDGRVGWRPDGAAAELIALPESLSLIEPEP
jgi:hypothetical protein